jgi:hypothetical protein
MNISAKTFSAAAAALSLPLLASAQNIVNIDFEGQRQGDAATAGVFVGQGAAGGGTFLTP